MRGFAIMENQLNDANTSFIFDFEHTFQGDGLGVNFDAVGAHHNQEAVKRARAFIKNENNTTLMRANGITYIPSLKEGSDIPLGMTLLCGCATLVYDRIKYTEN